jgi:hypothetical protein
MALVTDTLPEQSHPPDEPATVTVDTAFLNAVCKDLETIARQVRERVDWR